MFSELLDAVFAPLIASGLFFSLTAISILLSFMTTFFYRFLVDQRVMKEVRHNMEHYRGLAKVAENGKNMEKMNENVSKMMELNRKYFSLSMKPMVLSLVVFAVVFPWMGVKFASVFVNLPFSLPIIGERLGWFGWYFLLAIPGSVITRKLLDVE